MIIFLLSCFYQFGILGSFSLSQSCSNLADPRFRSAKRGKSEVHINTIWVLLRHQPNATSLPPQKRSLAPPAANFQLLIGIYVDLRDMEGICHAYPKHAKYSTHADIHIHLLKSVVGGASGATTWSDRVGLSWPSIRAQYKI